MDECALSRWCRASSGGRKQMREMEKCEDADVADLNHQMCNGSLYSASVVNAIGAASSRVAEISAASAVAGVSDEFSGRLERRRMLCLHRMHYAMDAEDAKVCKLTQTKREAAAYAAAFDLGNLDLMQRTVIGTCAASRQDESRVSGGRSVESQSCV